MSWFPLTKIPRIKHKSHVVWHLLSFRSLFSPRFYFPVGFVLFLIYQAADFVLSSFIQLLHSLPFPIHIHLTQFLNIAFSRHLLYCIFWRFNHFSLHFCCVILYICNNFKSRMKIMYDFAIEWATWAMTMNRCNEWTRKDVQKIWWIDTNVASIDNHTPNLLIENRVIEK